MRKFFNLGIFLFTTGLFFTSCEAWEDESYHPGGENNGDGMLLKEVKTTSDGVEGRATYIYDSNNRVKEVTSYANILDMESYTKTINNYVSDNQINTTTTFYMGGEVFSTSSISTTINGDNITMEIEMEVGGEVMSTMTHEMTFSAPCGVSENIVNSILMGMPAEEVIITYDYTDANCSYKEYQNGDLTTTVTNDNKFSPYNTPESYSTGIITHNYIRMESEAEGTVETVAYTYNENDYPTKAVHSFSEGSGQADFTEEFTYY